MTRVPVGSGVAVGVGVGARVGVGAGVRVGAGVAASDGAAWLGGPALPHAAATTPASVIVAMNMTRRASVAILEPLSAVGRSGGHSPSVGSAHRRQRHRIDGYNRPNPSIVLEVACAD